MRVYYGVFFRFCDGVEHSDEKRCRYIVSEYPELDTLQFKGVVDSVWYSGCSYFVQSYKLSALEAPIQKIYDSLRRFDYSEQTPLRGFESPDGCAVFAQRNYVHSVRAKTARLVRSDIIGLMDVELEPRRISDEIYVSAHRENFAWNGRLYGPEMDDDNENKKFHVRDFGRLIAMIAESL